MAFDWLKKSKKKTEKKPATDEPASEPGLLRNSADETALKRETSAAEGEDVGVETRIDSPLKAIGNEAASAKESEGLFKRLRNGLAKTRMILTTDIDDLFAHKKKLDDDLLENLEEILITADIGVQTSLDLIEQISSRGAKIGTADELKAVLREEILALLQDAAPKIDRPAARPHVVLVVGVNGVGKTTTIGKLAAKHVAAGKKVLIAAADTFRAAAIEQLGIWAERAGAEFVKHKDGADPAAVAYDGLKAAAARGADVVLIDTAGRLHTKINLMEELKKIVRTVQKIQADAPHEILLVVDATTGQNALAQANMFNDSIGITGIALTKLDGTAKGGIVVGIYRSLQIPLKYIGVGEKIEDLQVFDPEEYVGALF